MSYLHKRKILRYTRPGDRSSTGAHYDLIYLRGGTNRLVTAWIPIGDVPARMGGLVYLEGSHELGRKLEAEFALAKCIAVAAGAGQRLQQEHVGDRLDLPRTCPTWPSGSTAGGC